jgi:hypothetical protein
MKVAWGLAHFSLPLAWLFFWIPSCRRPRSRSPKPPIKNIRICQLRPRLARRHPRISFRMAHRLDEQTLIRLPRHYIGTGH